MCTYTHELTKIFSFYFAYIIDPLALLCGNKDIKFVRYPDRVQYYWEKV